MARRRGRCPRGKRLPSSVSHGHWKTTTFVASLRLSEIAAPFVLDKSIYRNAFQFYAEQVLVPELTPGDIVVMDNLGSYKGPAVHAVPEAAGARLLFLPLYSFESYPIEMAFSKLKALLREAAERTVGDCGAPSVVSSIPSHPTKAPNSSLSQDTNPIEPKRSKGRTTRGGEKHLPIRSKRTCKCLINNNTKSHRFHCVYINAILRNIR